MKAPETGNGESRKELNKRILFYAGYVHTVGLKADDCRILRRKPQAFRVLFPFFLVKGQQSEQSD
jgi:hypothetical protein